MVSFDPMAEEYAAGRPDHAPEVYEVLEPLGGRLVLEGGCGTGISTRALLERGAVVVPFDIGSGVINKARERTPGLPAVVADGCSIPVRDECADVVCFGQSWHWLDPETRVTSAARVLHPGGRWAAWWSHARADGEYWFDRYFDLIEEAAPGVTRDRRNVDEGETVRGVGLFDVGDCLRFPWIRKVNVDTWLLDDRSRSYVAAMPANKRERLIDDIHGVLTARFPDGAMTVAYETWMWIGVKR